jgi:hypothetical protein
MRSPLFLLTLGLALPRAAQSPEMARIQANGWAYDGQGSALASDGKSLLVGAPFGRSYAVDGSVRLYERDSDEDSGWREVQRIEAPGYGTVDRFGDALDVDGDVLAVGAWQEDGARGAAYVFERGGGGFELVARLAPLLSRGGQRFGSSLDLDGDRLLVGAPRGASAPDFGWEGRAYLYERDPTSGIWRTAAELERPDAPGLDQANFGYRVALSGDLALLTTYYLGFGLATEVHVFVLRGGTWQHRQVLSERDVGGAGFQSFFGIAIALEGSELFVMDPDRHQVHAFRRTPSGPAEFAWVGSIPADPGQVLAAQSERLAVGRHFRGTSRIQLFEREGGAWSRIAQLTGSDPTSTAAFGSSLLLDGEAILVGDPALPGPTQPEVGGVRVFRVPSRADHGHAR